jgi:alkylhydroperoxidase/carboxymuconolactone decarboxylase family protein YurZ
MSFDARDRRLVRLFVACVLGRWSDVRAERAGAAPGEPDRRWREAVLQVHVFAGFPRLVEAYEVLAESGGLGPVDADEFQDSGDPRARGRALFERIYADKADPVRLRLEQHHADYASWILEHAYGRVLARPGLAADRRELLAVAALAALGQDRQLASHARGAVRCGATAEDVRATLDAIAEFVEPERLERARTVVQTFAR